VISELLGFGHEVIASDRDDSRIGQFPWRSKIKFIPGDLNLPRDEYFDYFAKPELMIHLAWEGLPHYQEPFHLERNLPANAGFITNMVKHGLRRLVVIGTCLEYGLQNGCLTETMQTKPNNPYAQAKDQLRRMIEDLGGKYDLDHKWIRLFYLYGKGQNPNSLLAELDRALDNNEAVFNMSGGEQIRDYLPVEKAAEYIVKISLQDKYRGIFNCCSGRPIKVVDLVKEHLKRRARQIKLNLGHYPYPDYEPMEFWGDNARLSEVLKLYA
jgi:nucleoside-diphosphate-sugar epimerase